MCKPRSYIGALHDPQNVDKLVALGLSSEAETVLREGLSLNFNSDFLDKKWSRDNNRSSIEDPDTVISTIDSYLSDGFISEIDQSEAQFVNPLTVAEKRDYDTYEMKKRLCLDCSYLNRYIEFPKCKLPNISYISKQIRKGQHLSLIDMSKYYFHVSIRPDMRKYFCFAYVIDGVKRWFQFNVMPFGIACATQIMLAISMPVLDLVKRELNRKIFAYIDDFVLLLSTDPVQAYSEFIIILNIFQELGFQVNRKKIQMPRTCHRILGFYLNSETLLLSADERKLLEIDDLITSLRVARPVKILAKVMGKFLSLGEASQIPVNCFLAKTMNFLLQTVGKTELSKNWRIVTTFPWFVREELTYLLHNILKWTGKSTLDDREIIIYNQWLSFDGWLEFSGDGNRDGGAYYAIRDKNKFGFRWFTTPERQTSTSYRELLTLQSLISSDIVPPNCKFIYITDSQTLCNWMQFGSMKLVPADILKTTYLECLDKKVILKMAWANRSHSVIEEADRAVRDDFDEYTLREEDWGFVQSHYSTPFELDMYASNKLHRTPIFYTSTPVIGSSGAPGELGDIDNKLVFIFPPRNKYFETLKRLSQAKNCMGTLILLCNREDDLSSTWLAADHHFPSMVWAVYKRGIKVWSPYWDGKFLRSRHSSWFIFFNTSLKYTPKHVRCSKPPSLCDSCPGNINAIEIDVMYYSSTFKTPNCYYHPY